MQGGGIPADAMGMSDHLALVLARAIRAERARHGWNQTQLGERVGLSQSSIADIESGQRRVWVHELPDFCEALGVTLARLLADADAADLDRLGFRRH